jgi:hypothetical protein
MLACLASFFARTKIPAFLLSRSSDTTPTNLLFYGHIRSDGGGGTTAALPISLVYLLTPAVV